MKPLAALFALALAACSTKAPRALPVAPTVAKPVPSKTVDLAPVRADIGPVTESNRQLYQQILDGKRSIYELNQKLKSYEAGKVTTREEWTRLTELGRATANALSESERINADQKAAIERLSNTVVEKVSEVALSESEKLNLRSSLDAANQRITDLTEAQRIAAEAAASAEARVAAEKATASAERKWKWRFFGWACLTSLSTALLTYLLLKPRFL